MCTRTTAHAHAPPHTHTRRSLLLLGRPNNLVTDVWVRGRRVFKEGKVVRTRHDTHNTTRAY
jgi:hypothetical protein